MRILKTYFNAIVAMALSIATISCQKTKQETVIDSEIKLAKQPIVNLSSDAGLAKVEYTIDGKAAGQDVKAVSDAEWLKVLTDEEYNAALAESNTKGDSSIPSLNEDESDPDYDFFTSQSVKLSVSENLTSGERTAKLVLSASGAKDVTVLVVQKANPGYRVDSNQSFTLNVTDIESSSVHVEVAPTNSESYYYFGLTTASKFDSYGSPSAFLEAYLKEIADYVEDQSRKTGKQLTYLDANLVNKGFKSLTYNGLSQLTEYYLIAFDLTLGGENSGKISFKKFKTAATPPSSTDFNITVGENATVKVTPAMTVNGQYVVDVYPVSTWEQFTTPKAVAEEWLEWVKGSDYPLSQFLHTAPEEAERMYYNPKVQQGNVSTGDYVAFAFGTDGSKITTGVSYLKFHFDAPDE